MPTSVNLIPRNRLRHIPNDLRLAHEYCFFPHDECARILVEYEAAKAHVISVEFRNKAEAKIALRRIEARSRSKDVHRRALARSRRADAIPSPPRRRGALWRQRPTNMDQSVEPTGSSSQSPSSGHTDQILKPQKFAKK